MHQGCQRIGNERLTPSQQVIEHDARREQVGPAIHRLAAQLFGSHVHRRAQQIAGMRQVGTAKMGDAEIGQGDGVVRTHQNVGRFNISVNHAASVRVAQSV